MYTFKCTRCGLPGSAAKYADVMGDVHDSCLRKLGDAVLILAERVQALEDRNARQEVQETPEAGPE